MSPLAWVVHRDDASGLASSCVYLGYTHVRDAVAAED